MARSALQHFFLKLKTFQRQNPEAMIALEQANNYEWNTLSRAFIEDVVLPGEINGSYTASYGISNFSISTRDIQKSELVVEIQAEGEVDGVKETIRRVNRVSR